MDNRRYLLLVNDALKTHLLRLPEDRRRRLREKLEFLENGIWDAGVRVKKLRGTDKVIFEARLSRGDRLLFTLGRHRDAVAIYVWGLVDHDGIERQARRIEPANAPFLAFEEIGHEDRTEMVLDELPAPYFTQESVEERVPEDYGPQRWMVLDEEEWRRLLATPDASTYEAFLHLTREQEELLAAAPPVLLSGTAGSGKTTLSVYYLLRGARHGGRRLFLTYNPLLKRLAERMYGGLADHRAVVAEADPEPPRFALFREIALEAAGGERAGFLPEREVGLSEFSAILRDYRDRGRIDVELAWEEIRSIIKGATVPLDPKRCLALVGRFTAGTASTAERRELVEYLAGLRNLGVGRKAETTLIKRSPFGDWEELLAALLSPPGDARSAAGGEALKWIADLVAKHPADFSRPLLALDDYLALGRKRAPNFKHDRSALHAMAVFYQERLERAGRWDEIDLARAALRTRAASTSIPTWDLVVCDEVQDLADVQIALLFHLASDPRSVILTGDPRQILNPTGFRWEEVKYRFRERGLPVPDVRRLSLNFRCVGPIVRLANALLDLKASLVGLADTEMREEWKFGGRPPIVLEGATEGDLAARLAERGPGQVILTRDPAEAARLRELLATELVFTIAEAKGLEFDTVLLWRFADDPGAQAVWRAIAAGERPDEDRLPHVRYELALLYVAVTRARSTLLAWDGEQPAPVWDAPGVGPLVFRTGEVDRLAELWKTVSSPGEWEAQGDYFFERERYAAARECFRNAGAEAKAELAEAFRLEADGNHGAAAPLFERHGEAKRAAACWDRAGDWERAELTWRSVGEERRAQAAAARLAEARGELERAAQLWEDLGEAELAAPLWRRAGAFDRLARSALAARKYADAAELFERARMGREAAEAWEKAGQHERAGDLWLRLGDHAAATRLYRKSGSSEKLLRCLRQLGEHREAALLLEKRGEVEKAIEAFAAAAAVSDEERKRLESEVPAAKTTRTAMKAAIRLAALGRDAEAAPLFLRAGAFETAARRYERIGDHPGLARCHEMAGRWLDAARELGAVPAPDGDERKRAAAIQHLLYSYMLEARRAGKEEREGQALVNEGGRLFEQGNLVAALARFRLFGDGESVALVSRKLGWHEEAISWMLSSRNVEAALHYTEEGGFEVTEKFVDSLVEQQLDEQRSGVEQRKDRLAALVNLLDASGRGLPPDAARGRVEAFFKHAYGSYPSADRIPDRGFELLLRTRSVNAIMSFVHHELQFLRERDPRVLRFLEQLARAAAESGDPGLAACNAYAEEVRAHGRAGERFEQAVAGLPLSSATTAVLGRSRLRYHEAVDFLMEQGSVEDAETYCRANRDHRLAATWAEKNGDFAGATRYYREARDLDSALRCAQATGDKRQVARVLEWRGEFAAALAIWKKLGRKSDVARLLKKRPMLKR